MIRLLDAISFATQNHNSQKRKDKKTPYIYHPLAVALILARLTDDEDVIIAGICHDLVEDTTITIEDIEMKFGKRVGEIVKNCTNINNGEAWKIRKHNSLGKIKSMDKDSALVKSADMLHNTYDLKTAIEKEGLKHFNNFNANASDKMKYERSKLEELKKHHKDISLLKDIELNVAYVEKTLDSNK